MEQTDGEILLEMNHVKKSFDGNGVLKDISLTVKKMCIRDRYRDAIDWLIRSGIVNKCMKCTQGFYPVVAYQDLSAFKLYYSDMGIMSARMGMSLEALRSRETEHFRGIMTENYVSIALKTNGYQLYYWESDNTAEVDFLIQKENHVIPVECKAGNHVKAKSMMVYMEKYAPAYAIRISACLLYTSVSMRPV